MDANTALDGATAVVTGATRGIGREIALELARRGADIVVVGRTQRGTTAHRLPGSVEDTVDEIAALGRRAIGVHADLSDDGDTNTIADRAFSEFGGCDLLVNNAAYTSNGPILDVPWHRWERAFRVQVVAPLQLAHRFIPRMLDVGGGTIINVSSGASQSLMPGLGLYSTSKLAMERFAEYLNLEVDGVNVNTLRVDRIVATEGWRHIAATQDPEIAYGGSQGAVPITPRSVAAATVWLATRPPEWSGHTVGLDEVESLGGPPPVPIDMATIATRTDAPPKGSEHAT